MADDVEPILEEALDNLREATRASVGHTDQAAGCRNARAAQLPGPLRSGEHSPYNDRSVYRGGSA